MAPKFDWDPIKSALNWWKHDITLAEAARLWDDPSKVYIPARSNEKESRFALIGKKDGKVWHCTFALRQGVHRLISCRRARPKEISAYQRPGV